MNWNMIDCANDGDFMFVCEYWIYINFGTIV